MNADAEHEDERFSLLSDIHGRSTGRLHAFWAWQRQRPNCDHQGPYYEAALIRLTGRRLEVDEVLQKILDQVAPYWVTEDEPFFLPAVRFVDACINQVSRFDIGPQREIRAARLRVVALRDEATSLAYRLAGVLMGLLEQAELAELDAVPSSASNPCQLFERTCIGRPSYTDEGTAGRPSPQGLVKKLLGLYDEKYWPKTADLLTTLADDLIAHQDVEEDDVKAALSGRQSGDAPLLRSICELMEQHPRQGDLAWNAQPDWQRIVLTDQSVATLVSVIWGRGEAEAEPEITAKQVRDARKYWKHGGVPSQPC